MMKWLDETSRIDMSVATLIARDLRKIAEVDGHLHERELSLIDAFARELPDQDAGDDVVLETEDSKQAYLKSLMMCALADGDIADEEYSLIVELAGRQGISAEEVEQSCKAVKKEFFSIFSGVKLFRESLLGLAGTMGLDDEELEKLWD